MGLRAALWFAQEMAAMDGQFFCTIIRVPC
jgi:hypothetical protein